MKISLNRLRIQWKIFIFLLGFCALLLLILWLFQTVLLDFFYKRVKVAELKNNAKIIESNIQSEDLSGLVTGLSQSGDICIEVILPDGGSITSDILRECIIHKMTPVERNQLIQSAEELGGALSEYIDILPPPKPFRNESYNSRFIKTEMQPMQSLIYVKLINSAGGEPAAVLMNSIISPVNATVTTLRYQLYLITVIMLLSAAALALIIAKRVSRPIEEINKSAKLLACGEYNIHFDGKGYLEIGELSDTLNTAAAELSKVDALRRELMANISHDLRTPLSLIYSYAEMMHDFPNEITPEQTRIIMDEAERLTTLVNDILDVSKLEAGTDKLNITEFNLTQSLKNITVRVAELVKKDGYQIFFNFTKDAYVSADEVKITQAYYNLLINAINYAGSIKTVSVCQTVTEQDILIEVTDSGCGIEIESLPYIWDRYYKVDKSHKRAVTGTGLGLSIVKKIIEQHGGGYGVNSIPGQGSTFWFKLSVKK